LSNQGAAQLQLVYTPLSLDAPDSIRSNRDRDGNAHPYGAGAAGGGTYNQSELAPRQGSAMNMLVAPSQQQAWSAGRAGSKFSTNSLCNRLLPQGSAIQYLVSEIRAENCDLCHLQQGLQEIDEILSRRGIGADSPRPAPSPRRQGNNWQKQKQQLKPYLLGASS